MYGVVAFLVLGGAEGSSLEGGKGETLKGSSLMVPFCLPGLEAASGVPRLKGRGQHCLWRPHPEMGLSGAQPQGQVTRFPQAQEKASAQPAELLR